MEIRNKNLPGCCACSIKPWRAWKGIKGRDFQRTCTWITNQGQIILLSGVSTRRFYLANQLVMLRLKVHALTKHLQSTQGIECFHSRGQHLCKFTGTKESVCIRKEFNSHRTRLGHQHGRRFIVLGHQYGRRDVMWKHSIPYGSLSMRENLVMTSPYVRSYVHTFFPLSPREFCPQLCQTEQVVGRFYIGTDHLTFERVMGDLGKISCRLIWRRKACKEIPGKNNILPWLKKISLMKYDAEKNFTPLYVAEKNF